MKIFPKNEGLSRWTALKLKELGYECTPDDVDAFCRNEDPTYDQIGIRSDDSVSPYKFVAVWLNGSGLIFNNGMFRDWAKSNTPSRSVGRDRNAPYMINKINTFSYYSMYRVWNAGPACGLIWMGRLSMEEIMEHVI